MRRSAAPSHNQGPALRAAWIFHPMLEREIADAPTKIPVLASDMPIPDETLPRFLDDAAATKLLQAARADDDPFVRLTVEFLARTGMRKGEYLALITDAVVQIGSAYWGCTLPSASCTPIVTSRCIPS